jgi:hypothetical protein
MNLDPGSGFGCMSQVLSAKLTDKHLSIETLIQSNVACCPSLLFGHPVLGHPSRHVHQGREIIAIVPLENGAFCIVFSEISINFRPGYSTLLFFPSQWTSLLYKNFKTLVQCFNQ